jgi:hypothetical protein
MLGIATVPGTRGETGGEAAGDGAGEAAGETGEVGPVGSNDGAPLGGSASPATCWNAPR